MGNMTVLHLIIFAVDKSEIAGRTLVSRNFSCFKIYLLGYPAKVTKQGDDAFKK